MEFIKGMDISSYQQMKDEGKVYYDLHNEPIDAMDLAKECQANYIRLRIWNDPSAQPASGGYCGLEETIRTAKEIKKRGMKFLLDFHYSDWWADPATQTKPKAWEQDTVEELKEDIYRYTKEVLEALRENGVYPNMVQIGNEIRSGMLFPQGAIPNWQNLADFVNAGIKAVRDITRVERIPVMIHLDQGGRYDYFKEWFDQIMEHGVTDFDIIGLSFYSFWHGTFEDLKNTMEQLVSRYQKDLIIAETAYPYRKSKGAFFKEPQEVAGGFEATEENQRKAMELVMSITANISDKRGLGIFYWEPFTYGTEDENGWGNYMGFAKDDGSMSKGIDSYLKNPYEIPKNEIAKIYTPTIYTFQSKEEIEQMTVKLLKMDGTVETEKISVRNNDVKLNQVEIQFKNTVLTIPKEELQQGKEWVSNFDFAKASAGWQIEKNSKIDQNLILEYQNGKGLYFKGKTNFSFSVQQKIRIEKAGLYQPYLLYEGENTTGVNIKFYVHTKNEMKEIPIFPATAGEAYFKLDPVEVKEANDIITIGVSVEAPPVWGSIKKIQFLSILE